MSLAKGLSIYGNGVNLALALQSFSPQAQADELDATVLANTSRSYEQGYKSASATGSGVFQYDQTNLDKIHNILSSAFVDGSEVVITGSPVVLTVGGNAYLMNCCEQDYSINTPLGQLITVGLTLRSKNGLNFGKWLFNASVDDTTTNGTSVDNGAATSNGGIFHAHAQNVDLTDLSDAGITLQHSILGSVWVDLIAATAFSADEFGSISVEVAPGTTVYRYLRAVVATTGGAAAVQAAFSRR